MRVLCLLLACLWCIATENGAHAQTAMPPMERFTLSNGLEVVLLPNHRLPLIHHMIWFKTGAGDDPYGSSGLAHYVEHMMFLGTPSVAKGEYSKRIASLGGKENAFTGYDYTAYHATIAKEHLPELLKMEADRLRHLAPKPDEFAREREVILEERRLRVDSNPESLLNEAMRAALFRHHPYRIPSIGWLHEMQRLSQPKVMEFFRIHYRPDQAVVVVSGDVTRAEYEKQAEATLAAWKAEGKALPREWPEEPPLRDAKQISLKSDGVKEPLWRRDYMVPSLNYGEKERVPALYLAEQWLGTGKTSRLYRTLVIEEKLATAAAADYDGLARGPALFSIRVSPAPGVALAVIEAAVDRVLKEASATPPGAEELLRAKRLQKADLIFAQDGVEGLAQLLGRLRVNGLSEEMLTRWPETVDKVTAEDVRNSIAKLLIPSRSVTGLLIPEAPAVKEKRP